MTIIKDDKVKAVKVAKAKKEVKYEYHTIDIDGRCDNGCKNRCKQLRDA